MRRRSLSRDYALQILYRIDITADNYTKCLDNFWRMQEETCVDVVKDFTCELVKGVIDNRAAIDKKISESAVNWQLDRMSFIDRNVLRLSCYELLCRADIPPKVSINEAVELAKRYSGAEASKFVNGILDKIKNSDALFPRLPGME